MGFVRSRVGDVLFVGEQHDAAYCRSRVGKERLDSLFCDYRL